MDCNPQLKKLILILLLLRLEVKCLSASQLNMVPITLNPHITRLEMRNTRVVRLDDSFQFYEALIDLDLSFNRITLILEKSFVSQVIKQSQTELIPAVECSWTGLVKMIFQAKLLHLYLDHNRIENLSGETLFGLESLEYLRLSHNRLYQLPANLTYHAPNIKTIGRDQITLL